MPLEWAFRRHNLLSGCHKTQLARGHSQTMPSRSKQLDPCASGPKAPTANSTMVNGHRGLEGGGLEWKGQGEGKMGRQRDGEEGRLGRLGSNGIHWTLVSSPLRHDPPSWINSDFCQLYCWSRSKWTHQVGRGLSLRRPKFPLQIRSGRGAGSIAQALSISNHLLVRYIVYSIHIVCNKSSFARC